MILAIVAALSVVCNLGVWAMLRPRFLTVPVPAIVAYSGDFTFDHRGLIL